MSAVHQIPLSAIAADALARDRARLDPVALEELKSSILAHGLRQPIELFELAEPEGELRYGLIAGFRRLAAFRALAALGLQGHETIPAFLRAPRSIAEALVAMVEENAIRADLSPWEQALIALTARDQGHFANVEAAIDALYASFSRDRRYRLRAIAHLAEELDGHLAAPEALSLRRLLRLAAATTRGYADLMRAALTEAASREPEAQWRLLLPILAECEDPAIPDPAPGAPATARPRRLYAAPRHSLRLRRERTRDGWSLQITGRDATADLIDRVFDEIERLLDPA